MLMIYRRSQAFIPAVLGPLLMWRLGSMSLSIYKPHYCPMSTQPHTSEQHFQMYGFLPSKAATAVLKSLPFDQVAEFTSHITERISLQFSFTGDNTSLSCNCLLTLYSISPRIIDLQITNALLIQRQRADESSGDRQTISQLRKFRKSE